MFQIQADKNRKEATKRARLEPEQVHELLFSAFEKHQYYNVKDLVRITQQPIVSGSKLLLVNMLSYSSPPSHSLFLNRLPLPCTLVLVFLCQSFSLSISFFPSLFFPLPHPSPSPSLSLHLSPSPFTPISLPHSLSLFHSDSKMHCQHICI